MYMYTNNMGKKIYNQSNKEAQKRLDSFSVPKCNMSKTIYNIFFYFYF